VFFAAAWRRLPARGLARQKAAISVLTAAVAISMCATALVRSGSRGGMVFLVTAFLLTAPLWRHQRRSGHLLWQRLAAVAGIVLVVGILSWTRLPDIQERMSVLFAVEGIEGNSRVDLWRGTIASWLRAPIVGSGLGTYRYVIGMDKPATGSMILEQAHNDWLEWLSTMGFLGLIPLGLGIAGIVLVLQPRVTRSLRSDLRYPLTGASTALILAALHEMIGFGLQTAINRYLIAVWFGLLWGLAVRGREQRERARERARQHRNQRPPSEPDESLVSFEPSERKSTS
jgi:O-antigen ligase